MYIKIPVLDEEGHPIVIQTGRLVLGTANSFVGVDLEVEMADNYYYCIGCNSGNSTTTYNVKIGDSSINTTTQVKLLCSNANTSVSWLVMGRAKE